MLKTSIRYCAWYFTINEQFRSAVTFIYEAIMVLLTLNNAITRITQLAYKAKRFSWKGLSVSRDALKSIKIYKMCQLYLIIIKPFYDPELPIIIFCGSLQAVISNYGTIILYDKVLERPLYICFPCLSIIVIVLIATLLTQADNVFEKCQTYQEELKFTVKSKAEKAV